MCLLTKICHGTKCPRLENSALTYSTWEAISHYLCFLFWSGTERREKSTSCQSKLIHYIFLSKFMAFVFFLDLTIYSFWPFVYSNVYKIKLYLNITKYRLAMSRQKFKSVQGGRLANGMGWDYVKDVEFRYALFKVVALPARSWTLGDIGGTSLVAVSVVAKTWCWSSWNRYRWISGRRVDVRQNMEIATFL